MLPRTAGGRADTNTACRPLVCFAGAGGGGGGGLAGPKYYVLRSMLPAGVREAVLPPLHERRTPPPGLTMLVLAIVHLEGGKVSEGSCLPFGLRCFPCVLLASSPLPDHRWWHFSQRPCSQRAAAAPHVCARLPPAWLLLASLPVCVCAEALREHVGALGVRLPEEAAAGRRGGGASGAGGAAAWPHTTLGDVKELFGRMEACRRGPCMGTRLIWGRRTASRHLHRAAGH